MPSPFSRWKKKAKQETTVKQGVSSVEGLLLVLFFHPEDRGNMSLRNVNSLHHTQKV
jgi:hypothetical protein